MATLINGVGAWRVPKFYGQGMTMPTKPEDIKRTKLAIIGIQRELILQGFLAQPDKPLNGSWGQKSHDAVKQYQKDNHYVIDGRIGAKSVVRLFKHHFDFCQYVLGIPDNLLMGLCRLESALDPGAQGFIDNRDRGIAQFNSYYHPNVSDEIAYSRPDLCIGIAANMLKDAYDKYGTWDCAIAAHNNPTKAKLWSQTTVAPDEQIAKYVQLVRSAARLPV